MNKSSLKKNIIAWLKAQVRQARAKGLVVGLSGGIDSAVVAALAKLACGKKTLALVIPCESHPQDMRFARLVAKAIKIRTRTIQLDSVFKAFRNVLPPTAKRAALANIKPRLRMITLYYHAGTNNYLVAGTGNKVELELGYFTKYGDGGVDLLPLGDLTKGEVRGLAGELGIPQAVIDRAPTAGLWPGQTDEGEIGLLYDELDAIISRKSAAAKIGKAKLGRVRHLNAISQHKRCMPPTFKK